MPEMHFWDSVQWRKAVSQWAWTGGAWQPVKAVWIWSGGSWTLAFTSATISGLNGIDEGFESLSISWTFSGDVTDCTVDIYADFMGGTNFDRHVVSSVVADDNYYLASFEGIYGYSSLDNTSIRVRLFQGATLVTTLTMFPPYLA